MRRKKKNNNKLINTIMIIVITLLIILLMFLLIKNKGIDNHIVDINYDQYSEIINKDEYSIILLTMPTCYHCNVYKPYVNYVCDDYNLKAYNLNINDLEYDQYMEIHDKYNATKEKYSENGTPGMSTPTTIIIKNGEEIYSVSGNLGYDGLLNILKENKVIN